MTPGCYAGFVKRKTSQTSGRLDPNDPQSVERFRKAAEAFTARATKSREIALQVLVKEGICTKSGKLTKNYR